VALCLLQGASAPPVAGGDDATISSLVAKATAASGIDSVHLFGTDRDEDFSQFAPRGHYADDETLQKYFRAMIWLGRVDLRLVETKPDGKQVFNREEYDAMLLMRDLIGTDIDTWQHADDVIKTFVGKSDNMIVPEVDQLVSDLGGADAARAASDDTVERALLKGGYGQQQIASYLMVNDGTVGTLPLNRSFLIFGQRYIVDSNVFSATVYDRIPDRLMPNPLDAAFGALGNDQAYALDPDVATSTALPGALARVRTLIDANGSAFWESSFYNLWLSSLRSLSPAPDPATVNAGLPKVATTEAWGRRILNTQLGSWAELRHDTILYAKQSYTGGVLCEFPDAYVDPYPDFFAGIAKLADHGTQVIVPIVSRIDTTLGMAVATYFTSLRDAAGRLGEMAQYERAGTAFTADQMAFINQAVTLHSVCGGGYADGWYPKLVYGDALEFDPTIADVHTEPTDESGNQVGRVLHVGTGYARTLIMTRDTCTGPRAYAGLVFSYHEKVTENFQRLTDPEWKASLNTGSADDVPWMQDLVVR